ncbi:MAG: DUF502 domain-containing protein [Smithellaceae bacterium]|nr:DUF502 domain-containing protein [Smithellaceae bacterium]
MKKEIKNIFLAGLAVVIPIGLTIYILFFLIAMMDDLLQVIPVAYQPDTLLHFHIPGLGAIALVIIILISGLLVRSYVGNKMVSWGEGLVERIPVVKNLYHPIKQIVDSMFAKRSRSFKKVVLVEFPRKGLYAPGFITGAAVGEIEEKIGKKCVGVFVPTTPNPTSGYLIICPEDELIPLQMTVEEAFTFIVSVGIVAPHAEKINQVQRA